MLLRLLSGGAVGLAGWTHAEPTLLVAAKKCKKIKNKKKRKKCLAKAKTTPTCTASCAGKTCGDDGCGDSCGSCVGGVCTPAGACTCPSGTKNCGGACFNTEGDPRHCGDCGVRCNLNDSCVQGQCRCVDEGGTFASCPPGTICCGGLCGCNSGQFLDASTCNPVGASCPPGSTPCVATSNTCGAAPSKFCCPSGTTCTADGTCQLQ